MPQIAGFRGVRWDPTKVELAKVVGSPITGVAERLASGELVRDPSRAVYRYHQTFSLGGRSVTRMNLFAAVQLSPWTDAMIKPHESTDPAERDAEAAAIAAGGIHARPVLLGYRDAAGELDRLLRKVEGERPAVEVSTPDGVVHRLWCASSAELIGKVRPLFAPKTLHVLDGHARWEAMLQHQAKVAGAGLPTYASANYGLACLVRLDDPALVVAARHRIVKAASIQRDAVLAAARKYFLVEQLAGAAKDAARQHAALAQTVAHQPAFVVVFAGDADAWKLTLSPDISPTHEGVAVHRAIQKFDPIVVDELFLARAVPGATRETTIDANAVIKAVDAGASLGVVMRALSHDQITHADEVGALLPAGSTAFPPALANLVAFVVDPDEDLV